MEKVKEILEKLERDHDIKIIYSIEAGSRAWGLESEDSDYDIRFVYKCKNERAYLSLRALKDSIDGFSEDRVYDLQGWDITKSLKLIHAMNPSIVEWLHSPIVYLNDTSEYDFVKNAKALLVKQKRLAPLLYHYRSMAKSNYKSHIENKTKVNIKKYLYVIRPAGMVVWLMKCKPKSNDDKLIEINFNLVLDKIKLHMSDECYQNIVHIIEVKKKLKEVDEEEHIKCVDEWIESVLSITNDQFNKDAGAESSEQTNTYDNYDKILHAILNISFNNQH